MEYLGKGKFYNASGIVLLVIFYFVFQLVAEVIVSFGIARWLGISISEVNSMLRIPGNTAFHINLLRWHQLLVFVLSMAGITAFFIKINRSSLVETVNPVRPNLKMLAVSLVLILLAAISAYWLADYSKNLPLPKSVQYIADNLEKMREHSISTILEMHGVHEIFVCLFIVALVPAFFEEIIFRNFIQKSLIGGLSSIGFALIVQSLIFSALHFSIYQFLSIAFLGFTLGFIYYLSGSLVYGMMAHFIFNGTTVLMNYLAQEGFRKNGYFPAWTNVSIPIYIGLPCLILSITLSYYLFKKTKLKNIQS